MGVYDGVEVAGRDAWFEDEVSVGVRYTVAVVDDGQGSEAAAGQRRGDEDVAGAGVAGVAEHLPEGVFYVGEARGAAPGALDARQAGEARPEVPVWSVHGSVHGSVRMLEGPGAGHPAGHPSGRPRSRGSRG